MASLIVGGVTLTVEKFQEGPPVFTGTAEPAFAGNLRNGIRAQKRTWTVKTTPLLTSIYTSLRTAIANGAVVTVTGDLLLGTSFSAQIKVTQVETSTNTQLDSGYTFGWEVTFTMLEQ